MTYAFPDMTKTSETATVQTPTCLLYTSPGVLKTMVLNLGFEAFLNGTKTIRKMREKYNCNVPWLILMDPTSACNLHCTGCWAAEYGNRLNLTFDEMDSVVTQGKELGIYLYMFTGGEPLVRKSDIIKLCEKHNDCAFLSFTNGTLVDEAFCQEMKMCIRDRSKSMGDRLGISPFTMLVIIFTGLLVYGVAGFITGPVSYVIIKALVIRLRCEMGIE